MSNHQLCMVILGNKIIMLNEVIILAGEVDADLILKGRELFVHTVMPLVIQRKDVLN